MRYGSVLLTLIVMIMFLASLQYEWIVMILAASVAIYKMIDNDFGLFACAGLSISVIIATINQPKLVNIAIVNVSVLCDCLYYGYMYRQVDKSCREAFAEQCRKNLLLDLSVVLVGVGYVVQAWWWGAIGLALCAVLAWYSIPFNCHGYVKPPTVEELKDEEFGLED